MAKIRQTNNTSITQEVAQSYWNELGSKNISQNELEEISAKIRANNELFNDVHEIVGNMFTNDQINSDYSKNMFELSAKGVQRLIDTVDVIRNDGIENSEFSYAKAYKLPVVTEKNKEAIMMHFISNIMAGDASKGFMNKTVSLTRFTKDPTHEAEFIIPRIPEVKQAKEKIEKAGGTATEG